MTLGFGGCCDVSMISYIFSSKYVSIILALPIPQSVVEDYCVLDAPGGHFLIKHITFVREPSALRASEEMIG